MEYSINKSKSPGIRFDRLVSSILLGQLISRGYLAFPKHVARTMRKSVQPSSGGSRGRGDIYSLHLPSGQPSHSCFLPLVLSFHPSFERQRLSSHHRQVITECLGDPETCTNSVFVILLVFSAHQSCIYVDCLEKLPNLLPSVARESHHSFNWKQPPFWIQT